MGLPELGAVREGNKRAKASEGTRAWGIRSLTTLVGVFGWLELGDAPGSPRRFSATN